MLANIDVEYESKDIEDFHRIGKPDKANSKKKVISFANRKYCKKTLWNRKNWTNAFGLTLAQNQKQK